MNQEDSVQEISRELSPTLLQLSHDIHEHPELRFQEHYAASVLISLLRNHDFTIQSPIAGLETAFEATFGSGTPRVAFVAEYDALPEIGHACGHNIIATMSIGAALIAQKVMRDSSMPGTIGVIGSPGEEGGGGKIPILEAGIFDRYDVAMMLHPGDHDEADAPSLAREGIDVHFQGKPSHAASAPDQGIDALQAAVNFLTLINSMRATLRPDANIHSIITDGGQAPNIIPEHASVRTQIRARDREYLDILLQRTIACASGAAAALGAVMSWSRFVPAYWELKPDPILVDILRQEMARDGKEPASTGRLVGSTDMGNVSHSIPSVHGTIRIGPDGLAPHTRDFAAQARGAEGDAAAIAGAMIMARVALRVLAGEHGDSWPLRQPRPSGGAM